MWPLLQSKLSMIVRAAAGRLQRYLNRLSTRTLWIVAVVFFVSVASLLACMLVRSWHNVGFLSVQGVHIPAGVARPEPLSTESLRQQAILRHLQHVLYQMDSLRTHPATKSQYDSLMSARPGLLDSLQQAQTLFLHPFTNLP
jgi:hypothetical protein